MRNIYIATILIFLSFSTVKSANTFSGVDGEVMRDTDGQVIQAHGGQIQKLGSTYYWIGEDKTNDYRPCPGIHMYSSKDLYNWKNEGVVLRTMKKEEDMLDSYFNSLYGSLSSTQKHAIYEDLWQGKDGNSGCVIERPKMLQCPKTKKYVIWFHADGTTPSSTGGSDYAKAKAGVAISDSPTGPYRLLGTYLLIQDNKYDHQWDNIGGHVRDMNLFQDDDGTAYVIYSSDGNSNTYIVKLNDEYTGVSQSATDQSGKPKSIEGTDYIVTFVKSSREAPAMFKANNKYYMITSGCTGWSPNAASYGMANKVLGQWTQMSNPCTDSGAGTTYDTQSTCVFKYGEGQYIYMGDRWKSNYLRDSRYVWLPIEFDSSGHITIKRHSNWDLSYFDSIKPITIVSAFPSQPNSVSDLKQNLPSSIEIKYEGEQQSIKENVKWEVNANENAIGDVVVKGTLSSGRKFSVSVEIINNKMIYFFDCGAEQYGAGEYYNHAKAKLGNTLLNKVGDQPYRQGGQAGYSGTLGGTDDKVDISTKAGAGQDIWSHGFWAHGDKTIDYKFELDTGSYIVIEGFYEWWNTKRNLKITIKGDNDVITSKTFVVESSDTANQQAVPFSLSGKKVVTVSVSKTSGADPVLSWIAIIKN